MQNAVGAEAYGLYFALFNFSILFNAFLDLGITNFNNRSIAQSPDLIASQFPRIVFIKLLLGIVYLFFCLGTALLSGYSSNAFILLFILSMNQILASFLLFLRSNISGLQMYFADSILSVVDRLLLICLSAVLLWTNLLKIEISIKIFALLQTVAYALASFVGLASIIMKSGRISFKGVPLFSVDLFRKSFPFALLALLMVTYNRIDAVLLERMLPNGARAAGIYAQSYRIFDAFNMISVLFASLLLPMFARLIAHKNDIKPLLGFSFSILLSGAIVLGVALIYFTVPFLDVLYKNVDSESHTVFVFLVLSTVPVSLSYIFGTLLTADGRLFPLNVIAGAALILNLILNIFLIPRFQVLGAAFAALISQLFVAVSQMVICKKRYSLIFSWSSLLRFSMLILSSFLISYLFGRLDVHVLLKLSLSLLFSGVMVFILKIVDLQEISSIIKSETAQ